jgi:hypothetical protein
MKKTLGTKLRKKKKEEAPECTVSICMVFYSVEHQPYVFLFNEFNPYCIIQVMRPQLEKEGDNGG